MMSQFEISALITPREAAQILHIHINTLRRWGNTGILQQYRVGSRGDRRFIRGDINRFLKQLQENGGNRPK